jgi:photosystem II stability/assembly factor-like uncharacterized protein
VTKPLVGGMVAAVLVSITSLARLDAIQGWANATGNLAYKLAECGNMTLVSAVPDSTAMISGIAGRGLWLNADGGNAWTRLSDVAESDRITNRPSSILYDPTNPSVFWESGNYGPGIFKTTDGGKTFRRLGEIGHNDFISVDFSDPERRTILAGGHEQERTIYLSIDGGKTWKNAGGSIVPGMGHTTHPYILDALTFLVNASSPDPGKGGIFRSKDGGDSWQRVSPMSPASAPLVASNRIIYWPAGGRMLRSTDRGQTWTATGSGLRSIRPAELPDNRLVAVGQTTLMITSDAGATWLPFGPTLPYEPHGLTFSAQRKAFFVWRGDCREHVAGNAIMRLDLDDTASSVRSTR